MLDISEVRKTFTIILTLFIFCLAFLALFKPSCVMIINKDTGKLGLSWTLLFLYSIIFSIIAGIIYINMDNVKKEPEEIPTITTDGYSIN